jgi:hypothetical protein
MRLLIVSHFVKWCIHDISNDDIELKRNRKRKRNNPKKKKKGDGSKTMLIEVPENITIINSFQDSRVDFGSLFVTLGKHVNLATQLQERRLQGKKPRVKICDKVPLEFYCQGVVGILPSPPTLQMFESWSKMILPGSKISLLYLGGPRQDINNIGPFTETHSTSLDFMYHENVRFQRFFQSRLKRSCLSRYDFECLSKYTYAVFVLPLSPRQTKKRPE